MNKTCFGVYYKMFVRSLFLGLGLLMAVRMTVAAKQITVDDDGNADFKRIQDAINAAKEGDLIQVAPGRYAESIKLKNKVILQGADAEATVIISKGDEPFKQVVLADKADSKISGFTIDGQEGAYGIVCTFSTLIVSNNFITHTLTAITGADSNVAITDNKIEENQSGISIIDSSGDITNNTVQNNAKYGISCAGHFPQNDRSVTIISNKILNNGGYGILVGTSVSAKIKRNLIANNSYDGINIYRATEVIEIYKNEILGNGCGISATGENQNVVLIILNTIRSNSAGICWRSPSSVKIRGNLIAESRGSGVFIAGTSEADIGAKDDFGMNSIYNNGVEIKILFDAMAKKEIFAIGNFWGTPEGPIVEDFSIEGEGKLIYKPWLKEDKRLSFSWLVELKGKFATTWGHIRQVQ